MTKREPSDLLTDEMDEMMPFFTLLDRISESGLGLPYSLFQSGPLQASPPSGLNSIILAYAIFTSLTFIFITPRAIRSGQSLKLSHLALMDGLGIRFTRRFLRT